MTVGLGPITDHGALLMDELRAGRPSRTSFGSKDAAFAWSLGAPRTFASFTATARSESMSFGIVTNTGGADAELVAEKAQKPDVAVLAATDLQLRKWAGLGTFSLERELSTEGLVQAVSLTIIQKSLLAFEKDFAAAIIAGKGSAVSGATWTEGVLRAIGQIVANGGNPTVIGISAPDFAAAISGAQGLVFSGTDAIPSFLGLSIHMSPGLTAGTAVVLDDQAVIAVEHVSSPVVTVDPYSKADTNEVRIVADLVAGYAVVSPASVVTVTKTAP